MKKKTDKEGTKSIESAAINKANREELFDFISLAKSGSISPISTLDKVLQGISLNKIKARIDFFDKNRSSLSYSNSKDRIKKVIMVEHKSTAASTFGLESRTMMPGSIFWRSRIVDSFKDSLKESEFWAPPDYCVKGPGRVNHVGQSVLYTALHPSTTAREVRSKSGNKLIVISYELIRGVDVAWVDRRFKNVGYSEETFKKIEKINQFISKNLRKIGHDAYVFSATFANHFLPHEYAGWVFKSTIDNSGLNYCFKPNRIDAALKILKVYAFECNQDGELGKLLGVYNKSEDGTYKYCADRESAINDWEKFVQEKSGDGSSGDKTTEADKQKPYMPTIITV